MASPLSLAPFPAFDTREDPSSLGPCWAKWLSRFETYLLACNIKDDLCRKRAMLLYCAGESVQEIFDTLQDTGDARDYNIAVQKLTDYFTPKKNPVFERFIFNEARPQPHENIENYHTRLSKLASTCEFSDPKDQIMTNIISTYANKKLRHTLLSKPDLTLDQCLQIIRADELAASQSQRMEFKPTDTNGSYVNSIINHKQQQTHKKQEWKGVPTAYTKHPRIPNSLNDSQVPETQINSRRPSQPCGHCGGRYPHPGGRQSCPAYGKTCFFCNKEGHFQQVCRSQQRQLHVSQKPGSSNSKTVHFIQDLQQDFNDQVPIFTLHQTNIARLPTACVSVNGVPITFLLASGSSVNIIGENQFKTLLLQASLQPTAVNIFPFGSCNPLKLLGYIEAVFQKGNSQCVSKLFVVPNNYPSHPILGYDTFRQLNCSLEVSQLQTNEFDEYLQKFPSLLCGVGKLRDITIKLYIDDTVPPVAQPHRRVPFHLRSKVEHELISLLENDIIEPVNGPTTWVSPLVIIPKPGNMNDIRICVDMRCANKAIKRQQHITPTIDDIIHDLNGAQFFSKIDLIKGYHQLELQESSRDITTFSTHIGLFRYKRLFFGVCSAAETFQRVIEDIIAGIPGVKNTSDDILVTGKTKDEHDKSLQLVLSRLATVGLTIRRDKCVFGAQEIIFLGHKFSRHGISPDPARIQTLRNIPPPTDRAQLRSLLGLLNYCSRFIPNYSTTIAPLRALHTQQDFKWKKQHQHTLDTVRDILTHSKVSYFDNTKTTVLLADASPFGLGAILAQEDKQGCAHIIAFASRSLTPVETRYSQFEREALALTWACEHFHIYLLGAPFWLVTDHKPLVSVLSKTATRIPISARIERWIMRLQTFDYKIIYRPGIHNPADYFSRHPNPPAPLTESSTSPDQEVEEQVTFISMMARPTAIKLQDLKEKVQQDPTLQAVLSALCSGDWKQAFESDGVDKPTISVFQRCAAELSIVDNLILKNNKLVLPSSLHDHAISLAHEGHPGIVRTKQLLRDKIWFPGIDKAVKDRIESCLPCQVQDQQTRLEPLRSMEQSREPWHTLHLDFCGPLPTGHHILVIMDSFSKFPVTAVVASTSATGTIKALNTIFSLFGIPSKVISDNGPPFNSFEFKDFAQELGFTHSRITPYWPQANGLVERMMQPIMKSIRAAVLENENWQRGLENFLRNYRATPHPSTGTSPAELMFNRPLRTKLPQLPETSPQESTVIARATQSRAYGKQYADISRHAKPHSLGVGDTVLLQQPRTNKFSPRFDHRPYTITSQRGTMVTATRGDKQVTRNSSFFKRWKASPRNQPVGWNTAQKPPDNVVLLPKYNLRPRKQDNNASRYNLRNRSVWDPSNSKKGRDVAY